MQNLSKRQIQLYRKLHQKKYRKEFGLFIAEGRKTVLELLHSPLEVEALILCDPEALGTEPVEDVNTFLCPMEEMRKLSLQINSDGIMAVARMPELTTTPLRGRIVFCDRINDPGNLGSIIRLCEWFGIETIALSEGTVDAFNPKVVQSARGSAFRMRIREHCDAAALESLKPTYGIYGADLEGKDINSFEPQTPWVLVMGSESHGISPALEELLDDKLNIKRSAATGEVDSLNVGHAAAILIHRLSSFGL